ncbi:MAG: TonB-dependent receptor domain-containing protein, partial [Vulcanimicrobiaceae bacterium]
MLKVVTIRATLLALAATLSLSAHAMADPPKKVDVPAGDLAVALEILAKQSGVEFVYSAQQLKGINTKGVHGAYTAEKAVTKLLEGTKLKLTVHASGALLISDVTVPGSAPASATSDREGSASGGAQRDRAKSTSGSFLLAQATPGQAAPVTQNEQTSKKKPVYLEEVVVTAERRTERLMDVPMSVTAFSQGALDEKGLHNIDDLSRVSPGVSLLRNGVSASGNYNDEDSDISIRGIDSTAGTSTTGIYIDDTPIQTRHLNFGTVNPYPALFDLDRVEVLKGPQGTLFGSGSEGGTIRFITPAPGLTDYSGYARAEFGQIDGGGQNYEMGAAFGGPIIDGVLGFRISASFREDGGWVDRVSYTRPTPTPTVCNPGCFGFPADVYTTIPTVTGTTEANANWHDTDTFRAALRWAPTDQLTIDPSIYVQSLHINDTGAYWLNISDPADNVYRNGNAQRNPSTDPWYIAALKLNWSMPWATLVSNTSYFSRDQHSVSDYSQWVDTVFFFNQYPPVGDTSSSYFTDHQNNFSQEIRLSSRDPEARIQWTAGVFYLHANEDSTEFLVSPDAAPNPPFAGNLGYLQPRFSMIDKQEAVFGEVNFKLSSLFKLTAGLRYSNLDYTGMVQEIEQGAFGSLNVNSTNSGNDKPLTPRFVFSYTPDADSLYYASAAKGFRPGGINTTLPSTCTAGLPALPTTFASDSLWQYELGSKNTLLDRRLTVSASVYYIDWKNIQQFVYLACGLGFDYNLGEVKGKGGDIEIDWRATENLTLGLMAAYTDSPFSGPVALKGPGITYPLVSDGDHLQASPWNTDANAEYVWNGIAKKPYLRLDYQFATAQHSLVPFLD